MTRTGAKGGKSTFWNDLRVKNGLLIKDIAELLNLSAGTVGGWFSGQKVPSELNLIALCTLFGVDIDKGREEFIKARNSWSSERGTWHVKLQSSDSLDAAKPATISDMDLSCFNVPADPEPAQGPEDTDIDFYHEVLQCFYGKLPYTQYSILLACVTEQKDLTAALYGKLSFEHFTELMNIWKKYYDN